MKTIKESIIGKRGGHSLGMPELKNHDIVELEYEPTHKITLYLVLTEPYEINSIYRDRSSSLTGQAVLYEYISLTENNIIVIDRLGDNGVVNNKYQINKIYRNPKYGSRALIFTETQINRFSTKSNLSRVINNGEFIEIWTN